MFYRWDGDNLYLECIVQPKSSEEKIVGIVGDAMKIKLKAAPTDGKANKQLTKFLAKLFAVKQDAVTIINGSHGRKKRLCIAKPTVLPQSLSISLQRK